MNRNFLNRPIALLSLKKAPGPVFFSLLFILLFSTGTSAQTKEEVFRQRAEKIVATLNLNSKTRTAKTIKIIAAQYNQLNQVHDQAKAGIAQLKQSGVSGEALKSAVTAIEDEKSRQLEKLHKQYVKRLNRKLTHGQTEKVKDGMTYNVMNVTYAAYQEMILSLTEDQKQTIFNWLKEAREKAMDEGSSEDKHKVFGKYKGKINNYLSAQGYDMKAEEKGWQQRLRDKRTNATPAETPRQTS